jgi:uncharacterized protein YndB with AHSA1/START domain
METAQKNAITVKTTVKAPIDKVWKCWTNPADIMKWCQASDDWHAPKATNDLREGGRFSTTMAAKDGSVSFDFAGVYTRVDKNKQIAYAMEDGRKVNITFKANGDTTEVTETFDPEQQNPIEMQRGGWQAILDSFRAHTEKSA